MKMTVQYWSVCVVLFAFSATALAETILVEEKVIKMPFFLDFAMSGYTISPSGKYAMVQGMGDDEHTCNYPKCKFNFGVIDLGTGKVTQLSKSDFGLLDKDGSEGIEFVDENTIKLDTFEHGTDYQYGSRLFRFPEMSPIFRTPGVMETLPGSGGSGAKFARYLYQDTGEMSLKFVKMDIVDPKTQGQWVDLTQEALPSSYQNVTPSGQHAGFCYENTAGAKAHVVQVYQLPLKETIASLEGIYCDRFAVSPDGKLIGGLIAQVKGTSLASAVWTATGKKVVDLSWREGFISHARWSRTGRYLAVVYVKEFANTDLYDAKTGKVTELPPSRYSVYGTDDPVWSSDDQYLAIGLDVYDLRNPQNVQKVRSEMGRGLRDHITSFLPNGRVAYLRIPDWEHSGELVIGKFVERRVR